jgi:hypothetical protein
MLAKVFEAALKETVGLNGSPVDDVMLKGLSTKLGKVIMDCFVAGETDPEALKKAAVEGIRHPGQSG